MSYARGSNARWAEMMQTESFPAYLGHITTGHVPVAKIRCDSIRGGYFKGYTARTTAGIAVKTTWADRKVGLWHRA